jgi:FMN phosphatase YigB (HAD superfamily)
LWIIDYLLTIRSLLFDFKVFAPFAIDYQKALDHLARRYGQIVKPAATDVFAQVELVEANSTKKEFDEFAPMMSGLLDEIEIAQVGNYSLNMGVKNGLASLGGLNVTVVALTELGTAATREFLKGKDIDKHIGKLVTREKIGEPCDLTSRLNRAIEDEPFKQEECVYFCNKLTDMRLARSSNFRTVVLPSRGEKLDLMMLEKPIGMIMSLEEIPNLLSIELSRTVRPITTQSSSEETSPDSPPDEPKGATSDFRYGSSSL